MCLASSVTTPTSSLSDEESISSKEASVGGTPLKDGPKGDEEGDSSLNETTPKGNEEGDSTNQDGGDKQDDKENAGFKVLSLKLVLPGVSEPIEIMVSAKHNSGSYHLFIYFDV